MRFSRSVVGAAMLAVASGEACVSVRTLTSMKEVVVTKTYEVTSLLDCPPAHTGLPSSAVDGSSPDVPTNKPPGSTKTITSTYVVTDCPSEVTDCPIGETITATLTTTVCPDDDAESSSPQDPSGTTTADAVEPSTTCDGEEEGSSTDVSSPEKPSTSADHEEATSTGVSSPEETTGADDEEPSSTDGSSPEKPTTGTGGEASSTDRSSPEETAGADEEEASSTQASSPEETTCTDEVEEPSSTDASSPEAPATSEVSDPEETPYTDGDSAATASSDPESPTSTASEPSPTDDGEDLEPEESVTAKNPATSTADEEDLPAASSTAKEEELPSASSTAEEEESTSTDPVDEHPVTSTEPAVEPTPDPEAETSTEDADQPSSTAAEETSTTSTPPSKPQPTEHVRTLPADALDLLRDESFPLLKEYLAHKKSKRQGGGCTLANAMVRREWQDLTIPEREEYIAAVKCLQRLPNKSDKDGARSRYDDFLDTWIGNATDTHKTASFFSYNRYFLHAYETALRDECGYSGAHPYWNWDRTKTDIYNSPMFDGSPHSLGGDGDWEDKTRAYCVATGPFVDHTANMGPGLSFEYNPRCVKRQLSEGCATLTTAEVTTRLVTAYHDIGRFQDAVGSTSGVYEAGRFTIYNNMNGNDLHSWVADPVSHLHHAGIDRLWWIWQLQDLENRIQVIAGPRYRSGFVDAELTDKIYLGVNGATRMLSELMDTMDGPFCYIYY